MRVLGKKGASLSLLVALLAGACTRSAAPPSTRSIEPEGGALDADGRGGPIRGTPRVSAGETPRVSAGETPRVSAGETPRVSAGGEPAPASAVSGGVYLGRRIAETMSYHGADWLVRPEREAEEDTSTLLEALDLEPGEIVCDVGAGNGYHALRMANAVTPGGRVVAVDLQPEMLALLAERAEAAGLTNIERVLATETNPRLPPRTCDLILLVDVYHELSNPPAVLGHLRRALKPGGRLALVEFRAEDPTVPIKPLHKMSKAQAEKELRANGFRLAGSFDGLPWQHLLFFEVVSP